MEGWLASDLVSRHAVTPTMHRTACTSYLYECSDVRSHAYAKAS